jgi:hypothetical protein
LKMLIYVHIVHMTIWKIVKILGLIYDHLVHFVFIWDIFPVLLSFNKKNLATLTPTNDFIKLHIKTNLTMLTSRHRCLKSPRQNDVQILFLFFLNQHKQFGFLNAFTRQATKQFIFERKINNKFPSPPNHLGHFSGSTCGLHQK